MKILDKGFNINYEVLKIGMVKPGTTGSMNGTPYPAKVQFRTSLSYLVEDDVLGLVEKEEKLEFRVVCSDNSEMQNLFKHVTKLKEMGQVLIIKGTLPRRIDGQEELRVVCFDTPSEIIKKYPLK